MPVKVCYRKIKIYVQEFCRVKNGNSAFQTKVKKIVTYALRKIVGLPFAARASGRTCGTFVNHSSLDGQGMLWLVFVRFNENLFGETSCAVRIVFDFDSCRFAGLNSLVGPFWDGTAAASPCIFDNQWLVPGVFKFESSYAVAA
jgi:hypothetical protein